MKYLMFNHNWKMHILEGSRLGFCRFDSFLEFSVKSHLELLYTNHDLDLEIDPLDQVILYLNEFYHKYHDND
jgi:hypothetical protein